MTGTMISPRTITAPSPEVAASLPGGIVVAVDGSTESVAALTTASIIAKRRGCLGHVVSVLPQFPSYQLNPGAETRMENVDRVRIRLRDSAVKDLMKAVDVGEGWSNEVVVGRPVRLIVAVAEERGADLIVIGRRAHGAMDRILGGETTLQVMRLSPIPVLGVPLEIDGLQKIVVAVDFAPSSARAAQGALEMIDGSGTLYLVHVEPPVELFPLGFTVTDDALDPEDIRTRLKGLVDKLHAPQGVTVEPVVLNGKPVPTIIEFADRVGAGMIASGSHGHTRLERFILGGVSTGLVRNARCPVLIAPPGD